ncbi:MAG: uracil phosphoribosyltransferase [Candidatus Nanopelagicales bacterium]|jgi:uracil phosphoribosyltransferase|nr:uracil phosphoribosyltransferase [Candidatus Nanopelagicales bacterium]
MRVMLADHPLVAHKLTTLRDARTDSPTFRRLVDELVALLAYEATRDIRVEAVAIETPVAPMTGLRMAAPRPVVVPILRAGLGMLEGMTRLLPTAEIGFLGMIRDEVTLEASTYADRLPMDLAGRQVFLLDPMLATGGTLTMAIDLVLGRGARDVTAICLLAAPEGIAAVDRHVAGRLPTITLVTAAIDERLNEHGYIVPGLGDAGDRLYGIV